MADEGIFVTLSFSSGAAQTLEGFLKEQFYRQPMMLHQVVNHLFDQQSFRQLIFLFIEENAAFHFHHPS